MSPRNICSALILLMSLGLTITSCNTSPKEVAPLFATEAPRSKIFKTELKYLEFTKRLTEQEKDLIENELRKVEEILGIPKALLWCVLFQESRFDSFKNATTHVPAKGLGQFTESALEEVNYDTDHYDSRSSAALVEQLKPNALPLDFRLTYKPKYKPKNNPMTRKLKTQKDGTKKDGNEKFDFPPQTSTSYYHASTAVFASGIYLNNRYHQLRFALEHQGISYNPQVLWLYAAAAYNKGSRAVFLLLTHEYMTQGELALSRLLQNSKATYKLFADVSRLEYPLREVWAEKTRLKYVEELSRNMEAISSCSLNE